MAPRKTEGQKVPQQRQMRAQPAETDKTDGGKANELETVQRLLLDLEIKLREGDFKPSIADLIRLLALRRELEEEQPKEINVRWEEPEMDGEEPTAG